ncbi:UbiA prenyltransferase [Annulohypoxylon truncatum]|uniref:UbiA prenyltransferase n=1 Tax=Annulohypoxylon truncatum TaxID=327061 RepID=UPI002008B8D9|nr:UbiA prenyltransferase [Annulohypoxylon truncatum]KAI1204148.1 UbiA prenyltransferase [Annulohypoxylon truncatum]
MGSKASNEKPHSAEEEAAAFQNNALAQQYGGGHAGGWVGLLPSSWVPYVQLARLSPPAALFLIYFPHFFGVILAAIIKRSPVSQVLHAGAVMFGGSFFFSNAAHGWNDLIDAPIDKSIARTSKRPIPRGAISPRGAFIFTATQAIGAASFLLLMPSGSAIYAVPNIIGTYYYPWAKRHTNFAQIVLGFCLAWGIMMGSCAMGLKPFTGGPFGAEDGWKMHFWVEPSIACLFLASILWTVIYDSIYAHQDVKDDIKVGLKSIAVLLKDQTKPALWLSLGCMVALLYTCGSLLDMGIQFHVIAAGGSLLSLGAMIANVELKDSASCWWWFRYGFWLAGGAIAGGLLSEYVLLGPSF